MKKSKIVLIVISLILLVLISFRYITLKNTMWETRKLATTAKVWGFLKYYHPNIQKDSSYWDQQLFTTLPKLKEAGNKEELSQIYVDLIETLGDVKPVEIIDTINPDQYFNKNFNLDWISNESVFTTNLCEKLKFIENNRMQDKHYYISTIPETGNIKLINEPSYSNFDWSKEENRLLSLFKYWNIIEYFFPYKYQMDQNWNEALLEMIPKFIECDSEQAFHLAMLEVIVKINDSHAGLRTNLIKDYFGNKFIPAYIEIIDNKVIVTHYRDEKLAKKHDILIGDVITKVNGKEISQILKEQDKYINASNPSVKIRNAFYAIFNGEKDSLEIEYIRNEKIQRKIIKRYLHKEFKTKRKKKSKWEILKGNIGYVNMGVIEIEDVSNMMDSLINTKAIVFDIRNYPRGTMYDISNYLNPTSTEFVKFTKPNINYPGKFYWTETYECGEGDGPKYNGQVVLLVNEMTQSHAEFTCMCLETAPDALIVGSQTSGADGNVSMLSMPGGFTTFMTGLGVFYPDGRETQRIGIVPDVEVKPTIIGIQEGKDEVLDKALEIINQGKNIAAK